MFSPYVTPAFALAGIVAIASYSGVQIYSAIAFPPGLKIETSDRVSNSLDKSFAASTTNPHHHVTVDDTRSVIVSIPNHLSHEQILARFLSGFFGGRVFAPERILLQIFGKQIVNFKQLESTPTSTEIWAASQISSLQLPPVHSILFGAFLIVDLQLSNHLGQPSGLSETAPSYIDIAFGADDGFISGVHRFSVSEVDGLPDVARHVIITFEHTGCNPRENKPLTPDVLQTVHLFYAMLLFREGVVSVLKAQ